jgi:hypothetical protein
MHDGEFEIHAVVTGASTEGVINRRGHINRRGQSRIIEHAFLRLPPYVISSCAHCNQIRTICSIMRD